VAFEDLATALWLLGIPLGLGLAGYGLLSRSAKAMLAASAVLCLASIPGFLGGAGVIIVLGAALAMLGGRRMKTFPAAQWNARVLVLALDGALLLWVGGNALRAGAPRPSIVDMLLWALLAAMTVLAWWPLPAHRREPHGTASL